MAEAVTNELAPRSTANMAAELVSERGMTRTLAIPPGLTHDEAVAWVMPWLGKTERIAQFVQFS
jgi:hypothetical protein